MAKIVLENVYKSFPNFQRQGINTNKTILKSIDFTANDGEFLVLVGPSGCGKSTLLRLIAGLEELTGGNIWIGKKLVNNLAPKERDIGMVFQSYALYPHLNVYDNMAFGLRRMYKNSDREAEFRSSWLEDVFVTTTRILPKKYRYCSRKEKAIEPKINRVAKLLQLESKLEAFPKHLSGGQKQRVALGRAIARNPQVFLMDEPLSNLDAKLRAETRSEIVRLQRKVGITTIYVTHDQTEAMTMGHRIAVMNRGEIQQLASPLEIYNQPANRFVAEFMGSPPMNFLPVKLIEPLSVILQDNDHQPSALQLTLSEDWQEDLIGYLGRSLLLGIRPEHLSIGASSSGSFPVEVDLVEALGNETYLTTHLVEAKEITIRARISPEKIIHVGDSIHLTIALDKIHLFDENQQKNIRLSS